MAQLAASSHQLVMITGDAPLTACYAASKVHIVTRDVLILSHTTEDKGQALHGAATVVKAGQGQQNGGAAAAGEQETDGDYVWVSPDEHVKVSGKKNIH